MDDPTPAAPRRRRITTEQVAASVTTTTVDEARIDAVRAELSERVTQEVRNFERHLSEVQGSMITAYESLAVTVAATNTAINELTVKVVDLTAQRSEDAAFIAGQKAVELAKAHDRELETARAQERAAVVLEMQAEKRRLDEEKARDENAANARDNKILTFMIVAILGAAASIAGYLVTGAGHQTGTSTVLAASIITLLVLVGVGLATRIKLER